MIRRVPIAAMLVAVAATVAPLAAQTPRVGSAPAATTPSAARDTTLAAVGGAVGAASDSALVELGRAVAVLAQTVQQTVIETANKPEVRLAAVQAAGQAVGLAQKALTENVGDLERFLAEASRALAALEATQRARAATPSP